MVNEVKNSKILVIDDMEFSLQLIREILVGSGYTNVVTCTTYRETLEELTKGGIDLVLLDLALDDADGLDVCKFITQNVLTQDIPIIIQSGTQDLSKKAKAFDLGAKDFISKPIDQAELLARVKLQLEQRQLYRSLAESNARMSKELKEARRMLMSLLPSEDTITKITSDKNLDISSYYQPSSELGGDFYDVFDLGDGRIGVFVWDFAGHGVSAAINTFRLHSLVHDNQHLLTKPGPFLTLLNNKLYKLLPRNQFVTMFYGIIDTTNKEMRYCCASCPPPALVSFKDNKTFSFNTSSFPLGIQDKHEFKTKVMSLKGWDAMLLYSDALIETKNAIDQYLTIDDLITHVNDNLDHSNITACALKDIIMTKFKKEFSKNLTDDLTLKIVKFN
ncbi:MAG: SpoIIE family protein phosphatase [Rickettsiales bacterium]